MERAGSRPSRSRFVGRRAALGCLALCACAGSPDEGPGEDAPRDGAAFGDAGPPGATCADYLAAPAAPTPRSFERDVMPILGQSCNFGSCHQGNGGAGHARLGPPCQVDAATGVCVFADGALTAETLDAVHLALLALPPRGGVLHRVEPGVPDRSFLLIKLADCQDELAALAGCADRCGGPMPPPGAFVDTSPARYEVLLEWVAQGAPR